MNADDAPRSTPSKPTWWPSGPREGRSSAAASSRRDVSSSAGSKARPSSDSTWPTARKRRSRAGTIPGSSRWRSRPTVKRSYSGGGEGRVVIWETAAATPKPIRTIEAHRGWVRAIAVSPDGKLLATGGNDRIVRLWDSSTGKLVRELNGHRGHIYSLEYHPDWQVALERRSSGCDQGMGSERRVKAIGGFDAKALHTYEGGQQVDFGGVRGMAISAGGATHRRRRLAQGDEPARGRARAARAGL